MKRTVRDEAIKRLELFIGKWEIKLIHPHFQPNAIFGKTTFDWMEQGTYMVQRTLMNQPEFPSSTVVYDYNSNVGTYVQHSFDSRGITRLYNMSIETSVWKIWRDTSDFSPLDFCQRFVGTINESRDIIQGSWEKLDDDLNWEHDFRLIYRKMN